ncbi:MAG: cobalamin-dependent protein [Thermoleophilia bacterium]
MGAVSDAIAALDGDKTRSIVAAELDAGRDPMELIDEARLGLQEVGDKFDRGEYFLIELIRAAQVFGEAAQLINPKLQEMYGSGESRGKVLLGTVAGDIHDLGKSIVKVLLEARGVEVMDLGVDVPADRFIAAAQEFDPDVVGMSALLTAAIPQFKATIEALDDAGVRSDLKVVVGGGTVIDLSAADLGADHVALDANEGVERMLEWLDASTTAAAN